MSTATEMLEKYTAAEAAVLEGKEYRLGDRSLRREDLAEIRAGRREWQAAVNAEAARAAGAPSIGGLAYSVARLDGR